MIKDITELIAQHGFAVAYSIIFTGIFIASSKKQGERIQQLESWKTDFLVGLIRTQREEKNKLIATLDKNAEALHQNTKAFNANCKSNTTIIQLLKKMQIKG